MKYETAGHFSGLATRTIDLTAQLPWLYVIVIPSARIIYIGETYDQGGLIVRLSSHFGPYPTSSLRQRAATVAGRTQLRPPFLIVAARLPSGEEENPFDAASKRVRLACESVLHEHVAVRFVARRSGWTIVSSPQPALPGMSSIGPALESIYDRFNGAVEFLGSSTSATPVHLVLLDEEAPSEAADLAVGEVLTDIEVRIHDWLIPLLKRELADAWWTEGVPVGARMECAKRREEEGLTSSVPLEAYLTLVELRTVIQKNWKVCGPVMEAMAERSGKDGATQWLVEINEIRKVWAHPLKQRYIQIDPVKLAFVRSLCDRVIAYLKLE